MSLRGVLSSLCITLILAFDLSAQVSGGMPPNIVLIHTDDQRWDTLCGHDDEIVALCGRPQEDHPMPTVEKMAAHGVLFANAFVTSPQCSPSRASLLSGGYQAHFHGVLSNGLPNGSVHRFVDTPSIATLLQDNGYSTALIGKYLTGYKELVDQATGSAYVPPGWDQFVVTVGSKDWNQHYRVVVGSSSSGAPGTGSVQVIDDGTYLTDFQKQRALDFIDSTCPEGRCSQPFFLMLSSNAPHDPATPADRYQSLYQDFVYRERAWAELPRDWPRGSLGR